MRTALTLSVLAAASLSAVAQGPRTIAPGIVQVGTIQEGSLQESSGVVASRQHPGVFWTHNDGKKERLYAIDRAGKTLAAFKINGFKASDWEDIAMDAENRLYISDTGNNKGDRSETAVHRLAEPDPKGTTQEIAVGQTWKIRFPQQPFDSEALFIHGTNAFLISKVTNDRFAELYRFPLAGPGGVSTLAVVGRLRIDSPVTAADISPDGKRLAVLAKNGAHLFQIDGNAATAAQVSPWSKRFKHDSMEACAFTPDGLLVTAESREIFLFTDEMFRSAK